MEKMGVENIYDFKDREVGLEMRIFCRASRGGRGSPWLSISATGPQPGSKISTPEMEQDKIVVTYFHKLQI